MALVTSAAPGSASVLTPDETLWDFLRTLRSSRHTGIPVLDRQLPESLGSSRLLVIHGDFGSCKTTLLRNVLASYVLPAEVGGHGLPSVLLDTEGTFDAQAMQELLEAKASAVAPEASAEYADEALSRLMVLRPSEPIDLLRQLRQLSDILAGVVAVDSMSAWQSMLTAFPRSMAPVLRECWAALQRLQREHSVAAIVSHRDAGSWESGAIPGSGPVLGWNSMLHLSVACCGHGVFSLSPWRASGQEPGNRFAVSLEGEVVDAFD